VDIPDTRDRRREQLDNLKATALGHIRDRFDEAVGQIGRGRRHGANRDMRRRHLAVLVVAFAMFD
jgi:hypothetical protein